MRDDIKVNLEREVHARVKARNKEAVMDALVKATELDVPTVDGRAGFGAPGRNDPPGHGTARHGRARTCHSRPRLFTDKAERRVRLGLILSQLVADNNLQATHEQVKAQIEDFAQSYEDPKEVLKYYFSDRRRLW